MAASPPPEQPANLRDLGFGRRLPACAVLASGALPAGMAAVAGAADAAVSAVAAAGVLWAVVWNVLIGRRLRRALTVPLHEMMIAVDQLRSTGQAPRIHEQGAPLLQPVLRRFNLAALALEKRGMQNQANLLSVEAAFDRMLAVLQSLREGVAVIDAQGHLALANRSARRLLNRDERLEGHPLAELLDGDLQRAVLDGLSRLDSGRVGEYHASDLQHGERIVDLSIVQVQSNRPDQDYGRVVVMVDVTRNHELNRLKDELLSSISHELRTPLTNMCSSSEILTTLTAQDEAEWREFALMLSSESRRLKKLVDDVMEYSMLETRRAALDVEVAELAPVLRTAVELVQPAAAERSIELRCTAVDGPTAAIDRTRLREAVCRILDNALKFTPAGGRVHVTMTTHEGLIEVAVDDSGRGIAAEDRQRVFERFSQVGDVMTEKPVGTGLGLSITQRVIDAMGGTIWCEDSPLGGARFCFVLPQVEPVPQ